MLRNVSISIRIIAIIGLMLLVIAGIVISMIYTAQAISQSGIEITGEVMMKGEEKRLVLGTQAMAVALGKALTGVKDRREQHDIIKKYIQDYRFEDDQSGYFFTYIGTTIFMHPTLPKREGEDLKDATDVNGVYYVRDLFAKAEAGGGFVAFDFPKPPSMEVATKLAYVEYIPGTDIWISTGVYVDSINSQKISIKERLNVILGQRVNIILVAILAVMVLFIGPLCFLIFRSIIKPINELAEALMNIAEGEGDLTHIIPEKGRDETSRMAREFNLTLEKIKHMVVSVKEESGNLLNIGKELAANMTETAAAVNEITANIQSSSTRAQNQGKFIKETNATMEKITVSINRLNEHVEKQSASVAQGSSAIEEMVANIDSVIQTLVKNSENVDELTKASEVGRAGLEGVAADIKEISKESEGLLEINAVMESIASQTNLLSMNAAIEAAHAGEMGRGFSVVAAEIRKLAESSSQQSRTISTVLKKIKESIDKITSSTENVLHKFKAIDSSVRIVADQENVIRNAMQEQGEGSKQVLEAVSLINEISGKVKEESLGMLEGSREIIREAANLDRVTHEIMGGMNEMAIGADEINIAVNAVNDLSSKNRTSIDHLAAEVSRFIVD